MNKKLTEWFPIIIVILLIFQNVLQSIIGVFRYYDEFFLLIFLLNIPKIIKEKKYKVSQSDKLIIAAHIVILVTGLLGNVLFQYQNIKYVCQDILTCLKFWAALYYFKIIFSQYGLEKNKKLYKILIWIIYGLCILSILNYLSNIFPYEIRYGIKSNQNIFGHPTYLCASSVFIYLLISLSTVIEKKEKTKFMIATLLIITSTLRSKAFVFVALASLLYYMIVIKRKKITTKILVAAAIASSLICLNQIRFYFFNPSDITARSALVTTSIKIANDHFPIGSGFGTFGSNASKINYSPIYQKYEINNVWGMTQTDGAFISDNFWPMIIGQFGYIGFAAFIVLIITIFNLIQKTYNNDIHMYYGSIMAFLYLLISSTTESAFVNPLAIMFALIIGYSLNTKERKYEKKTKSKYSSTDI